MLLSLSRTMVLNHIKYFKRVQLDFMLGRLIYNDAGLTGSSLFI